MNNAGIYQFAPLENVTAELFHGMFDLNVLGLLLTTQAAVEHFGPEGGSVINIGSAVSSLKSAECLGLHRNQNGGRCHHPDTGQRVGREKDPRQLHQSGDDQTEGVHAAGFIGTDFQKGLEAQAPLGRIGQTDDISPTAVYLRLRQLQVHDRRELSSSPAACADTDRAHNQDAPPHI